MSDLSSSPNSDPAVVRRRSSRLTAGLAKYFGIPPSSESDSGKWRRRRVSHCKRSYGGVREPVPVDSGQDPSTSLDTEWRGTRESVAEMAWTGLLNLIRKGGRSRRKDERLSS